jgi:hypothetical protein
MLLGAASAFGVGIDFGVQLAVLALLVATASRLYPGIIT